MRNHSCAFLPRAFRGRNNEFRQFPCSLFPWPVPAPRALSLSLPPLPPSGRRFYSLSQSSLFKGVETPAYRHNDTDDDEYRHSYCGNYGKNTGGDYDNHGQVQVSNIFQSASVQESDDFTTNNTNNSSDPDDENRHNDNDRSANGFDNDGKYQNSYDNDDNMPSADRHCENNESSAKSEHPDGSNLTDSICSRQDRGSDNKYNICSSKDATHARRDETDENGFMNRYLREYLNVYHEEEFESIDDSNTIKILCFGDSNTWGYNTAATLTTKMSSESPLPQRGGEFPKRFPKHVRWTGRLEFLLNKLAWTRGATDSHNGQNNAGKSAREDGSEGNIHRSFGDARGTKKARRGSPHAVEVVEAGLNGRTTVRDDPMRPYSVNGRRCLLPCLATHAPVDIVIICLGINDLKNQFNLNAHEIASGLQVLIEDIKQSGALRRPVRQSEDSSDSGPSHGHSRTTGNGPNALPLITSASALEYPDHPLSHSHIILMPPLKVVNIPRTAIEWGFDEQSVAKAALLNQLLKGVAERSGVSFLEAVSGDGVEAVAEDGIHLTPASHKHIANHTADFILTHVLAEITESGSQGKGGVIADHSGEDSVDNDVCINGDVVSTRLNEDESKNPFFRKLNKTFVERTKSTQGGALSRTNSTSTTHQVPFVATGKMRQQLSKLGYTLCDIKALSPSQAHYLTDRNLSKQQLLALQYRRQQDRERRR